MDQVEPALELRDDGQRRAFARDLAAVINRHSRENVSDTPDFVLAEYLVSCLEVFELASTTRRLWNKEKGTQT